MDCNQDQTFNAMQEVKKHKSLKNYWGQASITASLAMAMVITDYQIKYVTLWHITLLLGTGRLHLVAWYLVL